MKPYLHLKPPISYRKANSTTPNNRLVLAKTHGRQALTSQVLTL